MSKNLSDIFPPTEIGGGGGGGIEEAPKTGKIYGRKDEAWAEFETGDIEPGSKDGETLAWSTADAEWMPNDTLIVNGDNVGIGTNDPKNQLHISSSGANFATVRLDAPENSTETRWQLRSHDGVFDVRDVMAASTRLTIDSSGHAGFAGNADFTSRDVGNEVLRTIQLSTKNSSGGNAGGLLGHDGTNLFFNGATNRSARQVTIDPNGNVGVVGNANFTSRDVGNEILRTIQLSTKNSSGGNAGGLLGHDGTNLFFNGATDRNARQVTISSTGNVGIGMDNPSRRLSVSTNQSRVALFHSSSSAGDSDIAIANSTGGGRIGYQGGTLVLRSGGDAETGLNGVNAIQADPTGNVGIGMVPLRSTAKEQLAEWKSQFDARLKAEPKADKKAVTLEITDDAFEVLPTEDKLAEWMETRAAGDKLQVAGNISADGYMTLGGPYIYRPGFSGIGFGLNQIVPRNKDNDATKADVDLGSTAYKFKDAYFSGMVRAGNPVSSSDGSRLNPAGVVQVYRATANSSDDVFMGNGAGNITSRIRSNGDATFSGTVNADALNSKTWYRSGQAGLFIGSSGGNYNVYPTDGNGTISTNSTLSLGLGTHRFKDAHFSGTVYAADHVASSDERLKDNITTAPVGLIDSLKGREWDWKESGEKGSGVVAQELEQVLPHLVHTDDEGMKSVSYMGLCAYLIEEVKALRAEVEALKS